MGCLAFLADGTLPLEVHEFFVENFVIDKTLFELPIRFFRLSCAMLEFDPGAKVADDFLSSKVTR